MGIRELEGCILHLKLPILLFVALFVIKIEMFVEIFFVLKKKILPLPRLFIW